MIKHLFSSLFCLCFTVLAAKAQDHLRAGNLNPILPGYFADPTIKKIGDTYFIYATTDGNGGGLGPSQVWTSKDFLNWTIQPMNWPNTHWYWAPDMTKGYDNRYYLYYSQPVEIYGAVSDKPTGPWESLTGSSKSIIPNYMIPGVITLDAQTFTDDDGKIYMYWGTWGIYPDHGCAVGLLNSDMKSFEKVQLIPNTDVKDFFEAPYVFKRNGIYYFMYSSGHCEDHTYRVQYATSKAGPMGPFQYESNNPILETNSDGTIHGPGHHSLIEEDGRYFIVYHRHNNPHSGGGFHRQIAVDELLFESDGKIKKVEATHQGVKALLKKSNTPQNIAFGKKVSASSYYNEDFKPSFLVDDNNGTLWRAKENTGPAWFSIDLEQPTTIQTIALQFEYPTYAYQYTIETSLDGAKWDTFVDQSKNDKWASPILEHGNTKARYVKVHIHNAQHPGLPKGMWNVKIYQQILNQETIWSAAQVMPVATEVRGKLVHINAEKYNESEKLTQIENQGLLSGTFDSHEVLNISTYQGKKAFYFDGSTSLKSTFKVPTNLIGNNAYTVSMWVNNPQVARYEDVLAYSKGTQDLTRAVFGVGTDANKGAITHGAWPDLGYKEAPSADQWNHVVFTFDGYLERIYVNGILQKEQNRMLFVKPNDHFFVGASDLLTNYFSGYLADLKVYNVSQDVSFIEDERQKFLNTPTYFSLRTHDLPLGNISTIRNQGTIEPQYISIENALLEVIGSRTAIAKANVQDQLLQQIIAAKNYSLEFDFYENKGWNHYVLIGKEGKLSVYKNGTLQRNNRIKGLAILQDYVLSFQSPFHMLNAYPNLLTEDNVVTHYQRWKNTFNKEIADFQPQILHAPKFINDHDFFIHAESPSKNVKYAFTAGNNTSGWIAEPYYLFKHSAGMDNVAMQIKDQFGNVSRNQSFNLTKTKPSNLNGSNLTGSYSLKNSLLLFWDGIKVPTLIDSTRTAVQFENELWSIKSTHTKWGNKDLAPPFLYKELTGDFTVQVKITDVAGWKAKTRTSSESGIMIRDAQEPNSYINNTVLTGWNLGNLWRSVGDRQHQEGNNGTGLQFHPYLQVQKVGNLFFLRTSKDGVKWEDLPNMPCKRDDLNGKKLQIGIYQVATNNQEGYGEYADIKLWY